MKRTLTLLLALLLCITSLKVMAQSNTLTVADGTATNSYVPVYGLWMDNYIRTQTIYPASMLGDMAGGTITEMKFYFSSLPSSPSNWTSVMEFRIGECNNTTFSSTSFLTDPTTTVYTGTIAPNANSELVITFTTPYTYNGGNLLVEFASQTSGGYSSAYFYGISSPGSSISGYNSAGTSSITNAAQRDFIPKATFTYTGGATCLAPTYPTISNISVDGATLSWTPRAGQTLWEVYCDTGNVDMTYVTGIPVGPDTFYTFSNLDPNTLYTAYVRTSCVGEYSVWNRVSFYTLCAPLTTLPMYENFDSHPGTTSTSASTNNLPNCWHNISGPYASYSGYPIIYSSSSTASSGTNAMRFYTSTTTSYSYGDEYAILPQVDVTYYPINTLQLTMDVRKNSTSYADFTLYVGVMSDPLDASTFVPVDTIVKNSTTYEEFTVMFNNYMGMGDFIALCAPKATASNVSYNCGYVDNLVLEPIPSCIKPTDVTLSNITATSVDVTWTPGGLEPAWEVVAVPAGTAVGSGYAEYTTTYPYTLSNLNDDTQYDVYVRADCGGGDYSSWSHVVTFTTDPLCTAPTHLSVTQVTGTSALISWNAAPVGAVNYTLEYTETGTSMWTPEIVNGTSYMLPYLNPQTSYDVRVYSNCDLSSADTLTGTFVTGCLAGGEIQVGNGTTNNYYLPVNNFYHYTYSQQIFLASELNGPTLITSVSFDYAYATAMTDKTNVNVYLGHTSQSTFSGTSDYIPLSSLQLVYSGSLNCQQGWNTFNFTTPFQYNGTDNLVLAVDDNSDAYDGSAYVFHVHSAGANRSLYFYSDSNNPDPANPTAVTTSTSYSSGNRSNVKFGGNCDSLTTCIRPNVYVSTRTNESITIDWAPGYMESSWDLEYSTDDTTWISLGLQTSAPYVLDNLAPNTVYYIRIRSNCGGGEYSEWAKIEERTECGYIGIPYMEGFESAPASGSGNMITCWSTISNYTSTHYPYTSNSQKHSGTYSVYFYATSTYYSYLVSPRFEDNVQMNNLEISFWAYKSSASYYIQVGVMSDPDDPTTFVQIGQFSPSATSTWESYEVTTASYTGNGHYIAFRLPNDISNYIYLDDINIAAIPTCPHVTNIHVDGTTLTGLSADVIWTPGGTETEWEYVAAPANTVTNPENETSTTVYTATASLTGLTANTPYDVFVRANCSFDDNSRWEKYTFRTACDVITSLPFVEYFDTYGTGSSAWVDCWQKISTYTLSTTLPYVSGTSWGGTAGADGSVGYLYFYTATSGTYTMAVTPPFDTTIPINTLRAKFKYKRHNSNDEMIVGVLTDPQDGTTFVPVDTVTVTTTDVWTDTRVDFSSYTGTGRYIGFMCMYHNSNTYSMVDNLSINIIPNCLEPNDFMVSSVDENSVSFTWSAGNETEWELYVVPAGAPLDSTTPITLYDTTYTYLGLNAATAYDAYLRAVCSGSGYSDYSMTHFSTTCTPLDSLPFTENFDSYTGATSTTASTSNLPLCWNNISGTYTSYAGYPIIYSSSTYAASGSNALRFYSGTTTSYAYGDEYAILPGIDATLYPINTLQLTMNVRKNSTSYADFTLIVGVMSNPTDVNTFVPVDTIVQPLTTYEEYTVYFANYTGTGNFIALLSPRHTPTNVTYNTGYVDDIVVDFMPSCPRPLNVAATAVSNNSIDLTWADMSSGAAASWEVEYGTPGFTPGTNTGTVLQTYTNSITLSNLTSNTTYEIYVKADCGMGDVSDYSTPITVSTTCDLMTTLPFTENFDSYSGATSTSVSVNNLPNCWNHLCGTYSSYAGYPIIYSSSTYAASGTNAVRFYTYSGTTDYGNQYAILPPVDATIYPINTLQLTMDVRKNSTSYADFTLIVGVMSNPEDASTFVPVDTIVESQTSYNEYTVLFTNYSGSGNFVAMYAPKNTPSGVSYNTGYVDNIVLEEIPSCVRPSGLQVNGVTNTTITLSWTENGTANSWEIEYGAPGFTLGSGTTVQATSNPMTVTALSPATNYEFYVRSVCSATDMSSWSNSCRVSTECDVLSVPYTEDFEAYAGTTYSDANGPVPTCWTSYGTNTSYGHPHVTGSGSYHYVSSGNNCLAFTAGTTGSGTDAYAMLPTFSQSLNTLKINFWRAMESTSYGALSVGYVTNISDPVSSYVMLESIPSVTSSNGDTVSVDFSAYPNVPATGTICFHWNCTGSFYTCCIDDVSVTEVGSGPGPVEPCETPQGLAITAVDNTTATLVWTPNANVQYWTMDYKKTSATTWTTVNNITSPTYTLTNLSQITQYDVRLAAVCGDNNISDYTPTIQFTTTNVGVNDYEMSTTLYPNPTTGEIRIQNTEFRIQSVEVYDVYGKLIKSVDVEDYSVVIDLSASASGVYFTRIMTDKGVVTKRVVKE